MTWIFRKINIVLFFSLIFTVLQAQKEEHRIWTELLQKHVSADGHVNYKGLIKDSSKLNDYLRQLERSKPNYNVDKQKYKAYWINAYNAYTIKLIIDNYPVKSIKEIGGKIPFVNSSWDIKFIHISNENLDLNNIEHKYLLRKFDDPRIHMAIVCASKSCPALRNEAYEAYNLENQLDQQSIRFLKDLSRNKISPMKSDISQIFKWYAKDFKVAGGVRGFINKYSEIKINSNTLLDYLNYDWGLNGN